MAASTSPPQIPPLPSISTLPTHPTATKTAVLDLLFEPSTPLHTLALPLLEPTAPHSFRTYEALITAIGASLTSLAESPSTTDTQWLHSILAAHPRLGEKKVDSALSRKEQEAMKAASGSAGQDGGNEKAGEEEALRGLNEEYENAFPGLRYVVFVNGRPRSEIMQNMRERIARGDIKAETEEAIMAMCDIAVDRSKKLA